jgi:polar amino acid transport system substrate-binding protein
MNRFRSLAIVVWLVAAIAGVPFFSPSASADERGITVSTRNLVPFVMTDGNLKSGFTIDILDEIAKRNGWKLTYVDYPSVEEELKAVSDKRADMAAAAISITAARSKNFDFSQPVMSGGPQILVPSGASEPSTPGLMDFLKLLFSKNVLVWLLAAVVITLIPAHIVWLLERRHPESMVSKSYFPGILQAFRWGLGSIAAASDDSPRHSLARIFAVLWGFVSIIFIAYYTATLSANFTVSKIDSQIKSASDLVGKRVCTIAKTTSAAALDRFGVTYDGVTSIDDCYKGIQGDKYDAAVYDAPVLSYYASQVAPGTVHLVGAVLQPEDYGIAFLNESPLREDADEALLEMREDGTYAQIKQKWFGTEASKSDG